MASLGAIIGWLQLTYEPPAAPPASASTDALPAVALEMAEQDAAPTADTAAAPSSPAAAGDTEATTDEVAAEAGGRPDEPAAAIAPSLPETTDAGTTTADDALAAAAARPSEGVEPGPTPAPPTEPQAAPAPADADAAQPPAPRPDATPDADTGPAPAAETAAVPTPPAPVTSAEPAAADAPAPSPQGAEPTTLAWRANARPFQPRPRTPRIAIVLWGLGLSKTSTSAAIQQLPGEVTLAFAPYGRDLQDWADQARAAGHEVLLQLPMEPESYPDNDPGPHTLLTSLPVRDNLQRLDWLLDRFSGYVGVTNYMGSRFTTSERHLRPVLKSLRERGLLFLDSRSAADSVAATLAAEMQMAHALNNRYIDNEASRPAIDARLLELERLAEARGYAVGIGFPYPVTIERVAQWARTLERKGVQLAPLSAVVTQQSER